MTKMIISLTGALGITANILIYQQKTGKKLLVYKMISDLIWMIHYFLLNAASAAAISIIGIFREFIFLKQSKKQSSDKGWLVFFLICTVLSAVFTRKGIFSSLPAVASVLSVVSFWKNIPSLSRLLVFPISMSMLIYDIYCGSNMGCINEIFTIISSSMGIIRYSKKTN